MCIPYLKNVPHTSEILVKFEENCVVQKQTNKQTRKTKTKQKQKQKQNKKNNGFLLISLEKRSRQFGRRFCS